MTSVDFLKSPSQFAIELLETPYTNQDRILIEINQEDTDMLNLCNIRQCASIEIIQNPQASKRWRSYPHL